MGRQTTYVCVCVCLCNVCMHKCTVGEKGVHMPRYMCMKVKGWCQISSFITILLSFFEAESLTDPETPWLARPAIKLLWSSCFCPYHAFRASNLLSRDLFQSWKAFCWGQAVLFLDRQGECFVWMTWDWRMIPGFLFELLVANLGGWGGFLGKSTSVWELEGRSASI